MKMLSLDTLINHETEDLKVNGIETSYGKLFCKFTRSQFDTKMSKLLSGTGGAWCQLCTADFQQCHDVDFVREGYPINRKIEDAKALFEVVDSKEFLALSSFERLGITNEPTSTENILSASPLHAYLRVFAWFKTLVCHLKCGKTSKWQPSAVEVTEANKCICSLIEDKISITIDKPTSQGGTTTTGNVVRRCMVRDDDSKKDFLYWILTVLPCEHHIVIQTLYNNLGAILSIYNCGQKVNTEELDYLCKETYEIILEKFPFANISPTLHKILAHSSDLIEIYNHGRGLKDFSEEGLESCNKYISRFRIRLARKTTFEDNFRDIFARLIGQSRPFYTKFRHNSHPSGKSDSCTQSVQKRMLQILVIEDNIESNFSN